jgi:hypothetical protein
MEIDVTLGTRQPEPVATTAAAVSVITRDDLRRSGVTTIADALQLATGVHVARFNNGSWSISARGFNGSTPNKLLVMVDGRTEFSPLFAGVFWNILDYVLEDIERIEVIRGPGATLWGANAVNGVVNIITRNSDDTQGTYASLAAGNEDVAIAELRHGAMWRRSAWRVYGEWTEVAVQGRWTRAMSARSHLGVQSYYRREYRNIARQLTHHVDTVDVDFQHSLRGGDRHSVIWARGTAGITTIHTVRSWCPSIPPHAPIRSTACCSRRTRSSASGGGRPPKAGSYPRSRSPRMHRRQIASRRSRPDTRRM